MNANFQRRGLAVLVGADTGKIVHVDAGRSGTLPTVVANVGDVLQVDNMPGYDGVKNPTGFAVYGNSSVISPLPVSGQNQFALIGPGQIHVAWGGPIGGDQNINVVTVSPVVAPVTVSPVIAPVAPSPSPSPSPSPWYGWLLGTGIVGALGTAIWLAVKGKK